MADTPKATPMTLEEAVEILSWGLLPYGRICWQEEFNKLPHSAENAKRAESAAFDRFVRARAIVDQAVKAHKARDEVRRVASGLQDGDLQCEGGLQEFEVLCRADEDEFEKLRALERGESEGKP